MLHIIPQLLNSIHANKISEEKPYFSIFKFQNLKLFKVSNLFWKILSEDLIYANK